MAPTASASDLAGYWARRFTLFEDERKEQLETVRERRQVLGEHHRTLDEVCQLRSEVHDLQRRLSEVQVQTTRERLRAVRLAAEHADAEDLDNTYRADVWRLLAAVQPPKAWQPSLVPPTPEVRPPDVQETVPLPVPACDMQPSRSVVRMVTTPNEESALKQLATEESELTRQLDEVLCGHSDELVALESKRAKALSEQDAVSNELRSELQKELAGIKEDRDRLAGLIEAYLQLRAEHVCAERARAAELDELHRGNAELIQRTQEMVRAGRREVGSLERSARVEAGGHLDFRKRALLLEQQGMRALCDTLEAAKERGEQIAQQLSTELHALRRKCALHKQRRRMALEGLRADISLVNKKLQVLEGVAEMASERLAWEVSCDCSCRRPASRGRQIHGPGQKGQIRDRSDRKSVV